MLSPSVDRARSIAGDCGGPTSRVALYPRDWAQAAAGATVVGARAAAFATTARLGCGPGARRARRVVQRRARCPRGTRAMSRSSARGEPECRVCSTAPSPSLDASWRDGQPWGELITLSRNEERAAWPIVDVIDVRREEPGGARLSARLVPVLRGPGPVVCVLNRTGRAAPAGLRRVRRARPLRDPPRAVDARRRRVVGVPARRRGAPRGLRALWFDELAQPSPGRRAGARRARSAGESTGHRSHRARTRARARGPTCTSAPKRCCIRCHAKAVVFLDFDQELLAPRTRASEQAMALLTRAARLVGAARRRWPHPGADALAPPRRARRRAARRPGPLRRARTRRRLELALPPFSAQALVSGSAAAEYVERLGTRWGSPCGARRTGSGS